LPTMGVTTSAPSPVTCIILAVQNGAVGVMDPGIIISCWNRSKRGREACTRECSPRSGSR
jgi:hypothetical protein